LDAAVFTRSSGDEQARESRQIQASLQALARCVGPSGWRIAERRPVAIFARQACERGTCRLGEASVTLSPRWSRTAKQPCSPAGSTVRCDARFVRVSCYTRHLDSFVYSGLVLFLAYFVRGMAGFGSGLIAVPLLSLVSPVTAVVPLVVSLDYLGS